MHVYRHTKYTVIEKPLGTVRSDLILGNLFSIKNYKKTYLNRFGATTRGLLAVINVECYLRHIAEVG